jgi:hypothetical protein
VEQPPQPARRKTLLIGAGAVAGLLWAATASSTRPFTGGADLVTAVPPIVAVTLVAMRMRAAAGGPTSASLPHHRSESGPRPLGRWSLVWLALTAAVGGWELFCYLSAPRNEHPTLSTLIDMLDSSRAGKISGFALWLALGWYLVWR